MSRDFGGLVRQHRERLGLSPGRVADLIGRSASTVRAWEKGRQTPNDAVTISLLAAVLDVDEQRLLDAAGVEAPSHQQTMTIEQALAEIAPALPSSDAEDDALAPAGTAATEEAVDVHEEHDEEPRVDEPTAVTEPPPSPRPVAAAPSPPPAKVQTISPIARPETTGSYLDDPEQRMVYRLRVIYTLVGLAVAFVVLAWAMANTFEALGQVWDQITGWL